MKLELAIVSALLVGGVTLQQAADSQDPREKWGDNPMENPEFMKAWMASATPGEAHAELAVGAGKWDVESRMYEKPGSEPMSMKYQVESRMVLGGRYLLEEHSGEMMGMPFEGLLLVGYDNLQEEYFSIWMDTWATWPSLARGTKNDEGQVVQKGTMFDVMTPDGRPYRHVSWQEGKDILHGDMYDTLPDGTDWKVFEMIYRRRAGEMK